MNKQNSDNKKILVTGIGGNVGQGILRNVISLGNDITLIGTDAKDVSAGNHLCNKVYKTPFCSLPEYIPTIIEICQKEEVDLIIPSTDYETYYLALERKKLPILASSDAKVAKMFLNKYQTWIVFTEKHIPFASTRLPSQYNNEFDEIILKPVEGVGSKGIHINPSNPTAFSDDFIIQEIVKGQEITTAFYVTKRGKLLGHITFLRSLTHGATSICEVTSKYDKYLEQLIKKIMDNFNIKGSCNIQSIVNNQNEIIPFEINCRISGTNSIRSQFGFEDVKYTIEEYLYNTVPQKPNIRMGSAVRILMDVIYPNIRIDEIEDKSTEHYVF